MERRELSASESVGLSSRLVFQFEYTPEVTCGVHGAPKSANWGCFSVLTCTAEGVLVNSVRHLAGGTTQPGSDSSPQTPAAWSSPGEDRFLEKLDYRLHKCMAALSRKPRKKQRCCSYTLQHIWHQ